MYSFVFRKLKRVIEWNRDYIMLQFTNFSEFLPLSRASGDLVAELVKADILDYHSLVTVIQGCRGVFHMAAILNDDPVRT